MICLFISYSTWIHIYEIWMSYRYNISMIILQSYENTLYVMKYWKHSDVSLIFLSASSLRAHAVSSCDHYIVLLRDQIKVDLWFEGRLLRPLSGRYGDVQFLEQTGREDDDPWLANVLAQTRPSAGGERHEVREVLHVAKLAVVVEETLRAELGGVFPSSFIVVDCPEVSQYLCAWRKR